jgi:hypothetical protein
LDNFFGLYQKVVHSKHIKSAQDILNYKKLLKNDQKINDIVF